MAATASVENEEHADTRYLLSRRGHSSGASVEREVHGVAGQQGPAEHIDLYERATGLALACGNDIDKN